MLEHCIYEQFEWECQDSIPILLSMISAGLQQLARSLVRALLDRKVPISPFLRYQGARQLLFQKHVRYGHEYTCKVVAQHSHSPCYEIFVV